MPNYEKMYAILCGAIDDVIDSLEEIPLAKPSAEHLKEALNTAEEIYIETSPYRVGDISPLIFPGSKK